MEVPRPRTSGHYLAFTLVELLVVLGVIALLVALLLPSLASARRSAKLIQCASNMRQLCTGLIGYASDNRGRFPVNAISSGWWYDAERIGAWSSTGTMVCPDDPDGKRSYSMNHWASAYVDPNALLVRKVWYAGTLNTSQMILLTEAWSSSGSAAAGWYAPATVGRRSNNAGALFGANGGVTPFMAGPWGRVNCELTYLRHRKGKGYGTEPIGQLNVGFADGHVEMRSNDDLADPNSGFSTQQSLWSPLDSQYP